MSKMTATSTSLIWRGTWESGGRLSIRLSEIEVMNFAPDTTRVSVDGTPLRNDDGTPMTDAAYWYIRLSSGKEFMNLAAETGNSIHEAWMHHLEHAVASRR